MTYPYHLEATCSVHAVSHVYVPTPSTFLQIGSITVSGEANKTIVRLPRWGDLFVHQAQGFQPLTVEQHCCLWWCYSQGSNDHIWCSISQLQQWRTLSYPHLQVGFHCPHHRNLSVKKKAGPDPGCADNSFQAGESGCQFPYGW